MVIDFANAEFEEKVASGTKEGLGIEIGEYVVQRKIAKGGFGLVYLVLHKRLQKPFALKCLHPHFASGDVAFQRFHREVRALSRISHPNVVSITDVGRDPQFGPYYVMEYVRGVSLWDLIRKPYRFSLEEFRNILEQLCLGLHAIHKTKLVHRDLKPTNLMLSRHMHRVYVKIVDFGLACERDDREVGLTREGVFVGTPEYVSPEQLQGMPLSPVSDLYTLGIVLYEMLSHRSPFVENEELPSHERIRDLVRQQLVQLPPPLARDMLPDGLTYIDELESYILHRLLSKKTENRPQSAKDALVDLSEILERAALRSSSDCLRVDEESTSLELVLGTLLEESDEELEKTPLLSENSGDSNVSSDELATDLSFDLTLHQLNDAVPVLTSSMELEGQLLHPVSSRLFRLMFRHSPDLSLFCFDEKQECVLAEGRMAQKHANSAETMMIWDALPFHDVPWTQRCVVRAWTGEEFALVREESSESYQVLFSSLLWNGQRIGVVFLRSLSHWRMMESRLSSESAQMEAMQKHWGAFSQGVTKSLRDSLASIETFGGLLLQNYNRTLAEEGRYWLRNILHFCHQLQQQSATFAHYATLQGRGRAGSSIALLPLFRRAALEQGLTEAQLEFGILPKVRGHRESLCWMLEHLIQNAKQFAHPERQLKIKVFAIEQTEQVQFIFEDNGLGFPAEQNQAIFDFLFRVDPSHPKAGMGIGLSFCRDIVHKHKGKIWAMGQPGLGAAICFTLPKD